MPTTTLSPSPAAPSPRVVFDHWLADINRACGAFSATMLGDHFTGSLHDFEGGAMHLSVVDAVQARLYRTPQDVGRSDDQNYFAVLQLRGQSCLEQGDRQAPLHKGDITLMDASRPFSVELGEQSRQISMILPRPVVERHLPHQRVACAQRIPASATLAGIAGRLMLAATRQSQAGLEQSESEAILDTLVSLLKPAIGLADAPEDHHARMFRKACDFIDAHLADEGLSPKWIAQSIGVSVRGLYRVFSGQGLVVAQYIQRRRLDRCAETLRQAGGREKLSALGYRRGFADSSHFSAAFKARFSVPPGEYRRRHLHA